MQNKEKEHYPKDPRKNLLQDTEENFQELFSVLTRAQRSGIHEISGKPRGHTANSESSKYSMTQ